MSAISGDVSELSELSYGSPPDRFLFNQRTPRHLQVSLAASPIDGFIEEIPNEITLQHAVLHNEASSSTTTVVSAKQRTDKSKVTFSEEANKAVATISKKKKKKNQKKKSTGGEAKVVSERPSSVDNHGAGHLPTHAQSLQPLPSFSPFPFIQTRLKYTIQIYDMRNNCGCSLGYGYDMDVSTDQRNEMVMKGEGILKSVKTQLGLHSKADFVSIFSSDENEHICSVSAEEPFFPKNYFGVLVETKRKGDFFVMVRISFQFNDENGIQQSEDKLLACIRIDKALSVYALYHGVKDAIDSLHVNLHVSFESHFLIYRNKHLSDKSFAEYGIESLQYFINMVQILPAKVPIRYHVKNCISMSFELACKTNHSVADLKVLFQSHFEDEIKPYILDEHMAFCFLLEERVVPDDVIVLSILSRGSRELRIAMIQPHSFPVRIQSGRLIRGTAGKVMPYRLPLTVFVTEDNSVRKVKEQICLVTGIREEMQCLLTHDKIKMHDCEMLAMYKVTKETNLYLEQALPTVIQLKVDQEQVFQLKVLKDTTILAFKEQVAKRLKTQEKKLALFVSSPDKGEQEMSNTNKTLREYGVKYNSTVTAQICNHRIEVRIKVRGSPVRHLTINDQHSSTLRGLRKRISGLFKMVHSHRMLIVKDSCFNENDDFRQIVYLGLSQHDVIYLSDICHQLGDDKLSIIFKYTEKNEWERCWVMEFEGKQIQGTFPVEKDVAENETMDGQSSEATKEGRTNSEESSKEHLQHSNCTTTALNGLADLQTSNVQSSDGSDDDDRDSTKATILGDNSNEHAYKEEDTTKLVMNPLTTDIPDQQKDKPVAKVQKPLLLMKSEDKIQIASVKTTSERTIFQDKSGRRSVKTKNTQESESEILFENGATTSYNSFPAPALENLYPSYIPTNQYSISTPRDLYSPQPEISTKLLRHVSKQVGKEWKDLGRELIIEEPELYDIEHRYYQQGLAEMAYQMLQSWKKKSSSCGGMKESLANALQEIHRADIVEKYFSSVTSTSESETERI